MSAQSLRPGLWFRLPVWLVLGLTACGAGPVPRPLMAADEPVAPAADEPTGQTVTPPQVPAGENVDPIGQLAEETLELMHTAHRQLAEVRKDEPVEDLQQRIIENLRRMQELASRQSPGGGPSQVGRPAPDATSAAGPGDGAGAAAASGDAAESSPEPRSPMEEEPRPLRKQDLATSVWGHLPPRQRERMQSRFSERFLPQYEHLVQKYFEALATERLRSAESQASPPTD